MIEVGNIVVVRAYSAGVHVGTYAGEKPGALGGRGPTKILTDAVRIWRWRGANSLHEVATTGVESAAKSGYTRVSVPVTEIEVAEAIETLRVMPEAWERIRSAGWAQ